MCNFRVGGKVAFKFSNIDSNIKSAKIKKNTTKTKTKQNFETLQFFFQFCQVVAGEDNAGDCSGRSRDGRCHLFDRRRCLGC